MLKKHVVLALAVFLALVFETSLYARGLVWNFLSDTHIDCAQDHDRIKVGLRHGPFRAVQLRVSDPIFIQRVVVYYSNGTSEELVVGDRVSPTGGTHIIDLTAEGRTLESVELWYSKADRQQQESKSGRKLQVNGQLTHCLEALAEVMGGRRWRLWAQRREFAAGKHGLLHRKTHAAVPRPAARVANRGELC
jgi:hypothetical protein